MRNFISVLSFFALSFSHSAFSAPTINSWVLPGNNSYPEGIARQPGSPYFYTGAWFTGTIWRGDVNSPNVEVFIPSTNTYGLTAAGGIKVISDKLFVAGASTGYVFVFDIETAALLHRFKSPYPGCLLNDMTVAENGNVYITDSYLPKLYVITAAELADPTVDQELDVFTELLPPFGYEDGFNSNGLVITEDQNYLLIGDYNSHAIFRLCLQSKEVTKVDFGSYGIGSADGMLIRGTTVFAVNGDNTLAPNPYIEVFEIKKPYLQGKLLWRIQNERLVLPATATFDGPDHLLVTNFQIAKAPTNDPKLPFTIARVPIKAGASTK